MDQLFGKSFTIDKDNNVSVIVVKYNSLLFIKYNLVGEIYFFVEKESLDNQIESVENFLNTGLKDKLFLDIHKNIKIRSIEPPYLNNFYMMPSGLFNLYFIQKYKLDLRLLETEDENPLFNQDITKLKDCDNIDQLFEKIYFELKIKDLKNKLK